MMEFAADIDFVAHTEAAADNIHLAVAVEQNYDCYFDFGLMDSGFKLNFSSFYLFK